MTNDGKKEQTQAIHTPGEWQAKLHGDNTYTSGLVYRIHSWEPRDERATYIADVVVPPSGEQDEADANARLIAASPTLLRAAKKAIEVILEENDQVNGEMFGVVSQLLDAIDLAEPGFSEALDKDC